ncbi:MAG: hypothetical protein LUE10_05660 [Alistipes sp.]|nr:hypothetical protein [Alistipes sp.]
MEGEVKIYAGATSMVSCAGLTTEENFEAALAGRSGCKPTGKGFPLGLIDRATFPFPTGTEKYTFLEKMMIRTIGRVCDRPEVSLADKKTLLIISSTKGNIELLAGKDREPDRRVFL